jgi:hypothetical protein
VRRNTGEKKENTAGEKKLFFFLSLSLLSLSLHLNSPQLTFSLRINVAPKATNAAKPAVAAPRARLRTASAA